MSDTRLFTRIEPQWGVHEDIDFWDYIFWDAWGSGEVRGATNPAKLKHARDHGKDANQSMLLGRAIHACVLEPDTTWNRYHVLPEGKDRRHKEYKEAVEEYGEDFVIRFDEKQTCLGVRDSLNGHSRIKRLLKQGRSELTFAWKDPDTGLPLKGRADWVNEGLSTVFDLKSTGDASERRFARIARDQGYAQQGVHYTMGLTETGIEMKNYTIVAVEVDPPYLPILYSISTKDMMIAEEHWMMLKERLAYCVDMDEWPGYPEHTHVLHMGNYWEADMQEEIVVMRESMS